MVQVATRDSSVAEAEILREKMTQIALEKGLSSVEAVKISQELDALLNGLQENKAD